ncbi:MAG: hypothetical protein HY790_05970 [Deltaproteobacteria bacterium]|nr:hypothetical protein [Deltaproteobacteria bacterium]MBI4795373.1 hypothetical protein [Deltaproteobacteria bacterium]
MLTLKLKWLQFTRCRNWLKKSNECPKEDPFSAFIFAWISFNHYYSTFAAENKQLFDGWRRQHRRSKGDKTEILFLVHSQEFSEFFDGYRKQYPQRFELSIELPVIDMLYGTPVPNGTRVHRKLSDLANEDIFRVIYQIRNNLFHGSKDPMKDQRDYSLCVMAGEFMIPLVATLLTNTYGEVNNGFDKYKQGLRDYIRKLAEA